MFPNGYFPPEFFVDFYFPPGGGDAPVEEVTPMYQRIAAPIAASTSGINLIAAAVSGHILRVIAYQIGLSAGGTPVIFKFKSASTDITGAINLADGSPPVFGMAPVRFPNNDSCLCQTASGEALNLNLSGAVAVGGWIVYEKVPVVPGTGS